MSWSCISTLRCIGYDNRFGHDRTEGFSDYVRYGREMGIDVVQSEPYLLHGVKVSSSVVRSFIQEGEIEMANECLGYPYTIEGKVVDGVKEGRRLGFPTANLVPSSLTQLLPAAGVYGVKVRTEGSMTLRPAMTNIGMRPTFGGHHQTVETNIFDFEDNIYGQRLLLSSAYATNGSSTTSSSSSSSCVRTEKTLKSGSGSMALSCPHRAIEVRRTRQPPTQNAFRSNIQP